MCVLLLLDFGDRRFEILEGQLPFVLAELLGALAVNDMIELGHKVLEALVELPQRIPFAQQRGDSFALRLWDGGKVYRYGGWHGRRVSKARTLRQSGPEKSASN